MRRGICAARIHTYLKTAVPHSAYFSIAVIASYLWTSWLHRAAQHYIFPVVPSSPALSLALDTNCLLFLPNLGFWLFRATHLSNRHLQHVADFGAIPFDVFTLCCGTHAPYVQIKFTTRGLQHHGNF